jgi:uncharacterized small protein (DUF1192 family)
MSTRRLVVLAFAALLAAAPLARADTARAAELEKEVKALEAEVARLEADRAAQPEAGRAAPPDDGLRELERRIDLLAAEIEKARTGGAEDVEVGAKGEPGLGPAASKVYRRAKGVSIGGYGEALYQNFGGGDQSGAPAGLADRVDLERAVLYTGYKFSDRILFNSEIEYEHASTGEGDEEKGEVSVEFAYLDFKPWKRVGVRAGMVLPPLGFLNEWHEPPIFHGARRNAVESQIIPTTWHEVGVGAFGESGPFQWRGYVVAGLDSAGFTSEGIEEGRQQGSQSLAEDLAFTGRLDYVGVPGLIVGASLFTGNSGQGAAVDDQPIDGRVTLYDVHAQYEHRGLQVRVLYAHSSIGDAALIDAQNGLVGDASVGERQYGFYAQAAYDVMTHHPRGEWSVSPFVRYERLNPQDRVPAGYEKDPSLDQTVWTAGVGVKPLTNVVLKADYQWQTNAARTGVNQWNLAIGYIF